MNFLYLCVIVSYVNIELNQQKTKQELDRVDHMTMLETAYHKFNRDIPFSQIFGFGKRSPIHTGCSTMNCIIWSEALWFTKNRRSRCNNGDHYGILYWIGGHYGTWKSDILMQESNIMLNLHLKMEGLTLT